MLIKIWNSANCKSKEYKFYVSSSKSSLCSRCVAKSWPTLSVAWKNTQSEMSLANFKNQQTKFFVYSFFLHVFLTQFLRKITKNKWINYFARAFITRHETFKILIARLCVLFKAFCLKLSAQNTLHVDRNDMIISLKECLNE